MLCIHSTKASFHDSYPWAWCEYEFRLAKPDTIVTGSSRNYQFMLNQTWQKQEKPVRQLMGDAFN